MTQDMTNTSDLRRIMVDTQVRPSDVTKFPVIEAMLATPREAFVPQELRAMAYVGDNVDLGGGRVLLEPRTLGKALDAMDIAPSEIVLTIGAGYGYTAALLGCLAETVVAVEDSEDRVTEMQERLSANGSDNVVVHQAPLAEGAAQHGPYDAILVEGGVEELPAAIAAQLKEGGRIVCLFVEGAVGIVRIGHKADGVINWRFGFNAGAPVLPGFGRAPAFAL